MKKSIIILPYFGKFNNYFELFLKSCSLNKKFDWIIFTDDKTKYNYPENVTVEYITFQELQSKIKNAFEFDVSIGQPYKLCDFKVAYGLIFSEYIAQYDFWGFCDCDLIFGDLSQYITEDILNSYDRIFSLGHLSLFRNTKDINTICLSTYNGIQYAERVFGNEKVFGFDEMIINDLLEKRNKRIYAIDLSANISVYYHKFRLVKRDYTIRRYLIEDYIPAVYFWNKGKIQRYYYSDDNGVLTKNEFPYIHLQQRKMKMDKGLSEESCIQILPNKFKAYSGNIENNINVLPKSEMDLVGIRKCWNNLIRWRVKRLLNRMMPGKFLRGRY